MNTREKEIRMTTAKTNEKQPTKAVQKEPTLLDEIKELYDSGELDFLVNEPVEWKYVVDPEFKDSEFVRPTKVNEGWDACYDLFSQERVGIPPGETRTVSLGIKVIIPQGYCLDIHPKSGKGCKGLSMSNCIGVIDSGYNGTVKACLINNHHVNTIQIMPGDAVVQCRLTKLVNSTVTEGKLSDIPDSPRGEKGFGECSEKAYKK